MEIGIVGIGTATPLYKKSQSDVADLVASCLDLKPSEKRLLKSVYKATGISSRYSVLADYARTAGDFEFFPNHPTEPFPSTSVRMQIYKDNALDLAIAAIENCLASCDTVSKSDITHLITVSCTGMYAPGLDIEITQKMELKSSIKRTCINFMGCYGAFNAIKLAESICKSEPGASVMIVSVELCTIHFQKKSDLDNLVANAIFADGAAAALITSQTTSSKYLGLNAFYCDLLPQSREEMAWHIADSGFDIVLSSYVPDVIASGIAAFAAKLFSDNGLAAASIDLYAIHPGGLKILQACETALDITMEDNRYSYQVLRDYGNMSSATVLFVLKAMLDDIQQKDHGKKIFSCAFGPGLTLESMLLTAHCL
ncbi:MAG: type III polyketide synthase [Gammaproteobacteria bacterium]|nr:type III polyketide synthase [Gammaproteobacteria bacterium]